MPKEWLHILLSEGVDKVTALRDLKYKYTVSDVYDLMELLEAESMYESEKNRINAPPNAQG